jgi:hypothetical protein
VDSGRATWTAWHAMGSVWLNNKQDGIGRDEIVGRFYSSHNPETDRSASPGMPAPRVRHRMALSVIIVSMPSAEVARPLRIGRSALVCSRSSAAHHDTHHQADAQRISVHTQRGQPNLEKKPCLLRGRPGLSTNVVGAWVQRVSPRRLPVAERVSYGQLVDVRYCIRTI